MFDARWPLQMCESNTKTSAIAERFSRCSLKLPGRWPREVIRDRTVVRGLSGTKYPYGGYAHWLFSDMSHRTLKRTSLAETKIERYTSKCSLSRKLRGVRIGKLIGFGLGARPQAQIH